MNEKIDFVITWVDGNDEEWIKEKNKYAGKDETDDREIRFRDWENLKYWFRGVEKYANWVNKIFFITCGHIPNWLDTTNPKLVIVNHKDYIPKEYLPTFSSHTIENNMYRIKDLGEHFVYFNDDMFIIKKMAPTDFFKKGKPCDAAILNANISHRENQIHSDVANMDIINSHFNKDEVIKKNFFKWFNLKYGTSLIRTICLMPWKQFPGIWNNHLPNSFLKSTFDKVWKKEFEILDKTCKHKFRDALDVNQWLFEDWQICEGNFSPRKASVGRSFALCDDKKYNEMVYKYIEHQKYKMICVNDMVMEGDFYSIKEELKSAFEKILSERSSFEKE